MIKADAEKLLRAVKGARTGGVFHVYQDVADALGLTPSIARPNKNFSDAAGTFEGEPVLIFHRAGIDAHYGPIVPQAHAPRERDAHLHDPNKQPAGHVPKKPKKPTQKP